MQINTFSLNTDVMSTYIKAYIKYLDSFSYGIFVICNIF